MAKKRRRAGKGEGSIIERKDGRLQIQISLEDGKRKTYYAKTREEAYEKLQKAQQELRQGKMAIGPQQTVKQFFEDWLENVHRHKIRDNSYVLYRKLLDNHILPALGHIKLQKLTTHHLDSLYARKLKDGYAAETVRAIHRLLHRALDDAVRWKRIPNNICDDMKQPKAVKHEIHPLTKEQAQMLIEVAKGTQLEVLITLAVTTAMRSGELRGLKWQDIDLQKKTLSIQRTMYRISKKGVIAADPKTEKSKSVIMLPQLAINVLVLQRERQAELRMKAGQAWHENDLVFTNGIGKFLEAQHLQLKFKKLLKDADLPDIRFHDLRHSAATILLSMGAHPKQVQELLRHSNIAMTMDRYSHVLPSMQRKMMDDLDDFFKQ